MPPGGYCDDRKLCGMIAHGCGLRRPSIVRVGVPGANGACNGEIERLSGEPWE